MTTLDISSTIGKYFVSQFHKENELVKTEISMDEYSRIAEINKTIRRMLYFKNKALECKLNILDYFRVVEQYSSLLQNPEEIKRKFNLEYTQTDINRVFNNFVISFKSLTENSEKMIRRVYSENSYEFKEYKALTAYYFDSLFSYRLFTRIRDYTIHYSQPIHLNINFQVNSIISVRPHFRKSELLRFKDIKRKLALDLELFEENILVKALIDEITSFIDLFYPLVIRVLANSERMKFEELLEFYQKYNTCNVTNMSLAAPKAFMSNRLDLNFIKLDIEEAIIIKKILE